jgi:hypothetical protein
VTKATDVGGNRTGVTGALGQAREAVEAAEDGTPEADVNTSAGMLFAARCEWSQQAEPVGTMPEQPRGESSAFIDRLSARLAFERTAVRLYEALLVKLDSAHLHQGGPSADRIAQIRDQELAHVALLVRSIEEMGGDPTAVTPGADLVGVATGGLVQVVSDPRVTLTQAMDALLMAELADSDGWLILCDVAEQLELYDMADDFRRALAEEESHVTKLRHWVSATVTGQIGIEPTPPVHHPPGASSLR